MRKIILAAIALLFSTLTVVADGLYVPGLPLSGGTLTGAINGPNIVNKVINVTGDGYGAKCDGSTDDYAAFNAASVTATANPGSTIYVPPSATSCLLSQSFALPTKTTLWAYPGTVTLAPKSGNAASILLMGVANFATNSTVHGITFDGGGVDFANANALVQAFRVDTLIFDQVIWQNSRGLGANISSSNRSGVRNSKVINVGNHWKTTLSASDRIQGISFCCNTSSGGLDNFVTGTYFENIGLDAINATNQTRFLASGNRFNLTSNQTSVISTSAYPAAIYCNTSSLIADGNSIFAAIGNGIDTVTCDLTISGNKVLNSGAGGLLITAGTSAVVSGNTFLDNNQVATGADANYLGGINFCGASTNVIISGNRSGNLAGTTQQNGIYGRSTNVGSCTSPTFTNLVISPGNDLSTNAVAAIGGAATGLTQSMVVVPATGGAQGAGTVNATGLYINGAAIGGNVTVFTSSGTFTPKATSKMVSVLVIGGGGGGGFGGTYAAVGGGSGGGGGGGSGYRYRVMKASDVAVGTTVTVGAAGAAGTSGVTPSGGSIAGQGGQGGISSFGAYAYGGGGGGGAPGISVTASGGGGGACSGNAIAGFGTNAAGGAGSGSGSSAGGFGAVGGSSTVFFCGSGGGGDTAAGVAQASGQGFIGLGASGGASGGGFSVAGAALAGANGAQALSDNDFRFSVGGALGGSPGGTFTNYATTNAGPWAGATGGAGGGSSIVTVSGGGSKSGFVGGGCGSRSGFVGGRRS